MRTITIMTLALALAGCNQPQPTTTAQDRHEICRSYLRNKATNDPGTYADCQRGFDRMANTPIYTDPPPAIVVYNR